MEAPASHRLLDVEITPEGQAVLDMIYDHLVEHGEWPDRRPFAAALFRAHELDLNAALGRLHSLAGEVTVRVPDQPERERVVLTLAGLMRVEAARADVAMAICVLRHLGELTVDCLGKQDKVALGDVAEALDLTDEQVARLWKLVEADGHPWPADRLHTGDPRRDLVFHLWERMMPLSKVVTAADVLNALDWRQPDLARWRATESPIGWLHETIARLAWANRAEVGHHLHAAEEHHEQARWDDCAGQLRKAVEQLVSDLSLAISTTRGEQIPAKQSKPKFEEQLDYVKARGLLGDGERKILSANYSWLSEKGAHPGIPDDIEGEVKWVVATELLRLLVTRAINMTGIGGTQ